MPVAVVELLILVVTDFYDAIFSTESVAIIVPYFMVKNLYSPVVEVFAIEEFDPFFFWRKTERKEKEGNDE